MTTHNDVLAEARAALPDLEAYVAHLAGVSMRNTSDLRIVDATRLLRALADECDALREERDALAQRVAAYEAARERDNQRIEKALSVRFDYDQPVPPGTMVRNFPAAPEPPSRETGADGAKSAPGIPE